MPRRPPARRTSDEASPLAGFPLWLRGVVWVGLPTAACIAFMYVFFTRFEAIAVHLQQEAEQSWQIVSIVQRICLNTAKTDDDKMACVTVTRRPE